MSERPDIKRPRPRLPHCGIVTTTAVFNGAGGLLPTSSTGTRVEPGGSITSGRWYDSDEQPHE